MRLSSDHDVYIFDCDGVILDSNQLKLDAMKKALGSYPVHRVNECIDYFSQNFGRSRYLHIEHFLKNILLCSKEQYQQQYDNILYRYADFCKKLYKEAKLNTGFIEFITAIKEDKYVASGSDEQELRDVFSARSLDSYFSGIFGSPESKANNIKKILERGYRNGIMFGDALGDLTAAKENKIDFMFVSGLSTAANLVRSSASFTGHEIKDFTHLEIIR
ncbi:MULTISPECIES: HAD family hydrolase [unclassified Brenneria]|uniref:HAD family hydrolase n=1 Tax=unclassified Brenneria TaxID=2634434 RepID=UPI0018F0CF55|nr:HAD family hydrolase [Brenneria sp. L3-3C-1]MBJ7221602.1 HAD family hydrolase [Brenneria sp. L3-3C-1]MEE3642844.1 HAD family hydrolase [Brenneria sp. L3_3C_1]